jgi:hypothetical protein
MILPLGAGKVLESSQFVAKDLPDEKLGSQESLGQIVPAKIRQIPVDIFGQKATVGSQWSGNILDHRLEVGDLIVHP